MNVWKFIRAIWNCDSIFIAEQRAAISVSAVGRPLCRPAQHLGLKTYDKETSRGRGIGRAGCGHEQVVPQFVVELGPGGAGFVPGTLAARLANLYHNAAAILREVSEYELRVRLQNADFEHARGRCCMISRSISPAKAPGDT